MKNEKKVVQTIFAINLGGFKTTAIVIMTNSRKSCVLLKTQGQTYDFFIFGVCLW